MKKKEQGILTIEASIVLTLSLLFILFLFGFARMYNAQSTVSHAVLQSSDAVALESYLREATLTGSEADVTELANRFMGTTSISADSYTSLRSADVPKIAKEKFVYALGNNETEADEKLKSLGVKNGLAGVDFSGSKMDLGNDDVIVYATYTIETQFPVFGMEEVTVTKAAKSKTFGDILFGIETIAEDPIMGSASGGGNYKYGTKVQITATPNYGYKFKKWMDGSTQQTRTVTVTGPKTYVAVFEPSSFGVTLVPSPEAGGTAIGAGEYKYLSSAPISAKPAIGYHFSKWSIYGHKDKTTKTDSKQSTSVNIDQSYTCTAHFEKNSYTVKVETSGTTSGKAHIVYNSSNHTSITAPYQAGFKLSAPTIAGYEFLGWQEKGTSGYINTTPNISLNIPAKNVTYVACYKSALRMVTFYNRDNSVYATRTVYAGKALGSNMPPDPNSKKNIGFVFKGWKNGFNSSTKVYYDTKVYGNWGGCNGNHEWGRCGITHPFAPYNGVKINTQNGKHYTEGVQCIVCAKCGVGAYSRKNSKTVQDWKGTTGWYYKTTDGLPTTWGIYCFGHNTPGACINHWSSNRIYPIHSE